MFNRKEYMKKYYQKNREHLMGYGKQWREDNSECRKKYYQEHKERALICHREWVKNNPEKNKEMKLRYSKKNRIKILKYQKQFYKEKKKYIDNYKISKGCSICGYNKCAEALCFHHNGDKEFDIASGRQNSEQLEEEMNKCIVLCFNCHQELHNRT